MKLWQKITLIGAVVLLAMAVYYLRGEENFPYRQEISHVPVYSKISWENLQEKQQTTVFKNENKAAITCNFEISAISTPSKEGYEVHIERGKQGVHLYPSSAYIKGENGEEIISSCHVFSCLFSGVKCPQKFSAVREAIVKENNLNLILDQKLGQKGLEAYTELLGVLGYLQAERADSNKDGVVSPQEKNKSNTFIRPYLKNNSQCLPQQFSNLFQKNLPSNHSKNCQDIEAGIFLVKSSRAKIEVQDDKVILYGNEKTIYQEAVILRDILSPEWIRIMYKMK